ncbi:kinase-like domain-containing protein [Ganoderma leucocontextum]|nr:kinase-like domain-containing protein [Ganoderma leucocontextum]
MLCEQHPFGAPLSLLSLSSLSHPGLPLFISLSLSPHGLSPSSDICRVLSTMRLSYGWEDLVGLGSYGKVFAAKITSVYHNGVGGKGETDVALKKMRVTNHVRHPLLLHEACVLILVGGHPNIPRVLAWGRSQYFEYMAMELLGPNLEVRNAVALICQMLDALEHVHGKGFVHGDIKPSNIVLGRGDTAGRAYLIDFGLAWRWTTDSPPSGRRGTVPFCSLRVLAGEAALPRDDLESLAYTVGHLLRGTLLWFYQSFTKRLEGGPVSGKDLFRGFPDVFAQFLDFARVLAPTDDLQYQRWREAFCALEPGLSEYPLFNQQDRSGHRVWKISVPPSLGEEEFYLLDYEEDGSWSNPALGGPESQSEMGGTHGFDVLRASEWLFLPFGLPAGSAMSDEFDVVAGHLDFIEEPPLYDGGRSVENSSPPEVMNNAQSDTHCIRP